MFKHLLTVCWIVSLLVAAGVAAQGVIWMTDAHPRVVIGLMAGLALWLGRPGHGFLKG